MNEGLKSLKYKELTQVEFSNPGTRIERGKEHEHPITKL